MIPISVVTLIAEYERNEHLESAESWFYDASKRALVIDSYLLKSNHLYELLEDEEKLAAVLEELPSFPSRAEAILTATMHLDGMETNPDTLKDSLFEMSGLTLVTHYLQWEWFRAYVAAHEDEVKEHIIRTCRPLRSVFDKIVVRRPLLVEKKDFADDRDSIIAKRQHFADWYFANFFTGMLTCDIETFVDCCSSHYDFASLALYSREPVVDRLAEPGAVFEAIEKDRLQSLPHVPKRLVPVLLEVTCDYFPSKMVETLKVCRRSSADDDVYADFALSQILNYKVQFLRDLALVFPLRFGSIMDDAASEFEEFEVGFGTDALKGIRSVVLELQNLGEEDFDFSSVLLEKFYSFVNKNEELRRELERDGLHQWTDDLLSRGILI